jgi:hypothetical protein
MFQATLGFPDVAEAIVHSGPGYPSYAGSSTLSLDQQPAVTVRAKLGAMQWHKTNKYSGWNLVGLGFTLVSHRLTLFFTLNPNLFILNHRP